MSFDLSAITANKNVIQIRHPATAEPIGLTITLRPQDSAEVKSVTRKQLNENLRLRGKMPSAEKIEQNRLDLLAAAVESWEWSDGVTWGGAALECSQQNVRRVLSEAPWLKSQIDDALGDEAAFFAS